MLVNEQSSLERTKCRLQGHRKVPYAIKNRLESGFWDPKSGIRNSESACKILILMPEDQISEVRFLMAATMR